jgi:hypothetical protein
MARADHTASIRLIQVLRTYCYGLDPRQMADLQASIAYGRYPWFREEFAAAIRAAVFDLPGWEAAIGPGAASQQARSADVVRAGQRAIWSAVFGNEPFPQRSRRTKEIWTG